MTFDKFQATSINADDQKVVEPEETPKNPSSTPVQEPQRETQPEPEVEVQPQEPETVEAPSQPQQQQAVQSQQKRPMTLLNKNGSVIAENIEDEWRLCKILAASGMAPKGLSTPEKIFVARQFIAELGLPLMVSLRNVCVINGVPSLWGDLPLALVRSSGKLEFFDEYFISKDGTRIKSFEEGEVWAAVCEVKRKGEPLKEIAFTEKDVKIARLDQKDIWKAYPRRMRQMRARSWALKDVFGDVLLGAAIAEYDYDVMPSGGGVIEVEQPKKQQSSLAERFSKTEGTIQIPEVMGDLNGVQSNS